MSEFRKWLETFLDEKNSPYEAWEIKSENGTPNLIDTDVVIEHIKAAPDHEQEQIKEILIKIDFANGNINHFFKHIAGALAQNM